MKQRVKNREHPDVVGMDYILNLVLGYLENNGGDQNSRSLNTVGGGTLEPEQKLFDNHFAKHQTFGARPVREKVHCVSFKQLYIRRTFLIAC